MIGAGICLFVYSAYSVYSVCCLCIGKCNLLRSEFWWIGHENWSLPINKITPSLTYIILFRSETYFLCSITSSRQSSFLPFYFIENPFSFMPWEFWRLFYGSHLIFHIGSWRKFLLYSLHPVCKRLMYAPYIVPLHITAPMMWRCLLRFALL